MEGVPQERTRPGRHHVRGRYEQALLVTHEPQNNELQRTSDGTAAGSPLDSVWGGH